MKIYISLHLKGEICKKKSVYKNMLHYNASLKKNAGPDMLGISVYSIYRIFCIKWVSNEFDLYDHGVGWVDVMTKN